MIKGANTFLQRDYRCILRFRCWFIALVACAAACYPQTALPYTNWNVARGSWFDASNWVGGVPASGVVAYVNNGGNAEILSPGANTSTLIIGNTGSGSGSVRVASQGTLTTGFVQIGANPGSSGIATVEGAATTWTVTGSTGYGFLVGDAGQGILNIRDGASVSVRTQTAIGLDNGTGEISFDNGTLTTGGLVAGVTQLKGTGVIYTTGLVSDVDLLFDQTHGPLQQLQLAATPDQNIIINLDVSGASTFGTLSLGAGCTGQGSLTISEGTQINSHSGYLGFQTGSTGVATVTGIGSAWNAGSSMYIGFRGTGELNILNGGKSTSYQTTPVAITLGYESNSIGSVKVNGAGSIWDIGSANVGSGNQITIGRNGKGTLRVENGGIATGLRTKLLIGGGAGSQGDLIVSGIGSKLEIAGGLTSVTVGNQGSGSLTIEQGGNINSTGVLIGTEIGSTGVAKVTGLGSIWTIDSNTPSLGLTVGERGSGSLTISDSAVVSNNFFGKIGGSTGGTGTVLVTGNGSAWNNSGSLTVGSSGAGNLTIAEGGHVTNTAAMIAAGSGSNGIVAVSGPGSQWINSGNVYIGGDSSGSRGTGVLNVGNGGDVIVNGTGDLTIWSTGTLTGNEGTVQANISNRGAVSPGDATGRLTIDGNYGQTSAGKLLIDLTGNSFASQFDSVQILGSATLAGLLNVSLVNNFIPAAGDTFKILDAVGGISSRFTTTSLPVLPLGLAWEIVYSDSAVLLNVKSTLAPGDLNGDINVDGADFSIWQSNFPSPTGRSLATGDADGDGDVDGADFIAWQTHYGTATSPAPQPAPVPEPPAILIGVIGLLMLGAEKVRQRLLREKAKFQKPLNLSKSTSISSCYAWGESSVAPW